MKIVIQDSNINAHVVSPGAMLKTVQETLRFRPPGYRFVDSYKKGYWDGFISLLDSYMQFPAGLVNHLLDSFPDGRKYIEVEDQRKRPYKTRVFPGAKPDALPMHEVQKEAVWAALAAGRGIINYPTGTGKGRIMGSIAAEICVPTLVIVDKTDLLSQLATEIEPFIGEKAGRIGGGKYDPKYLTIATIQSLASSFKRDPAGTTKMLQHYKAVIIDEVHHAESESYQTILNNMPLAYYRFGFSGTPFRSYAGKSDGLMTYLKVQAILGPPLATLSISEAVDTGRIVAPDIYMLHMDPAMSTHKFPDTTNMPYKDVYKAYIVDNLDRNLVAYSIAHDLPGQCVILVESLEHGQWFEDSGILFVRGETPKDERKRIYEDFKNGREKALVLSKLANEALDLPNINNLVILGGGQAPHIKIQQIGRALRAHGGKLSANVFDFTDEGVKYLAEHGRTRRKLYASEPAYTLLDLDESDFWDLVKVTKEQSSV